MYSSASVGGTVNVAASDVVFEGNTATSGGAVYLGGSGTSDIAFTDAVFKENQANTGNGGAIYSGSAVVRISPLRTVASRATAPAMGVPYSITAS